MTTEQRLPGSFSLRRAFFELLKKELKGVIRSPGQAINPLFFFLMVATLFPLGISPESHTLSLISGGVIWVGALLSVLLSLDGLFKSDQRDGSLEQLLLSPHSLPVLVLAKVLAHWLTTGFLLTLVAPLSGIMLFLPPEALGVMVFSLLLGTPLLSLAGAISAALTVRIQQGGVLMTLISLPLYIPVLIFGTGSIQAAADGLPYNGHLLWLTTFLVLGLCLAPLAIAGALRLVVD